jgi:uncharacterized protein YqhQ
MLLSYPEENGLTISNSKKVHKLEERCGRGRRRAGAVP